MNFDNILKNLKRNEKKDFVRPLKSQRVRTKRVKIESLATNRKRFKKQLKIDLSKEKVYYCPECGYHLKKRKSKFNDSYWYSCSYYPTCDFKCNDNNVDYVANKTSDIV